MILNSFKNFLRYEKRCSPHTITAYLGDIDQFFSFLEEIYPDIEPIQVKRLHVRAWIYRLMQDGINVKSIHRKISSLNGLYRFALREKKIKANPLNGVILPASDKPLPSYHSSDVIHELFNHIPDAEDYYTARDRCIPLVLLGTGIRRAELLSITMDDLRLPEGKLRIHGKRGKERILPLHEDLVRELTRLVDFRADIEVEDEGDHLFLTNKGKKLYPKYVYNLIEDLLGRATTAKKRGPHTLRHTFATVMLDAGADLHAIKELLGHAGLNATQVYTHTSIEKLKRSYNSAHPRAIK